MAIDLLVVLEPNQPVYFPGQAVSGYVKVEVQSETACREITVRLKGIAAVKWSERRGKTTHHYSNEEVYIRYIISLWHGRDTGDKIFRGRYKFPFRFSLPLDIPSSFEAECGKVRYQVKAVADIPWGLDETVKLLFSVNHLYDLNLDNNAPVPLRSHKEDTVCCCCFEAGPISLSLTAGRSGYVAGENIIINAEVVNNSGSIIKYTEAKIVQVIQYIATTKTKEQERTVQRIYRPQIEAGGIDVWSNVPLPVPAVPASHLKHCNIIVVNYLLMFIAKLGKCRSVELSAPLVIGTVPLQNTFSLPVNSEGSPQVGGTTTLASARAQPSPSHYQPRAPLAPPPHSAGYNSAVNDESEETNGFSDEPPPYTNSFMPDDYRDIPPPSYESCVFSSENDRALGNQRVGSSGQGTGFAPQYVTYRMLSTEQNNE